MVVHGSCILSYDHSVYRFRNIDKQDRGICRLKKICFVGVNAVILKNVTVGKNLLLQLYLLYYLIFQIIALS